MKTYSLQDKERAEKELVKSIYDFLHSKTLSEIYLGIAKKLNLDFRQIGAIAEITNVTLLGLEPESAMETNIHQTLHELSNQVTRELVADINDRIFKEARRRVAESIITPAKVWDTERLGSPEDYEAALVSDSEFDAKVAEEEKKTGQPYLSEIEKIRKHEEEAAAAVENRLAETPPRPLAEEETDDIYEYDKPEGVTAKTPGIESAPVISAIPISAIKLGGVTASDTSEQQADVAKKDRPALDTRETILTEPPTPAQKKDRETAPLVPPPARPKSSTDPYRESIE